MYDPDNLCHFRDSLLRHIFVMQRFADFSVRWVFKSGVQIIDKLKIES